MDKNGVIEFRCKKCGRCKRTLVLKKYTEGYLISHSKKGVFKL